MTTTIKTTLTNNVTVANFSSPHTFNFTDGSVLEAHPDSKELSLRAEDVFTKSVLHEAVQDVDKNFAMSEAVKSELERLQDDDSVDIILVPFPVLSALKDAGLPVGKARTVFMADRITKAAAIDRFCK